MRSPRPDAPDRDLRRAAGRGTAPDALVADIATARPTTARPDEPLSRAVRRMTHDRIGALPVVDDDGRLLGILTSADALAHCARVVE